MIVSVRMVEVLHCSNFDHYYFIPMFIAAVYILMVTTVTIVAYVTDIVTVTTRNKYVETRRIDK